MVAAVRLLAIVLAILVLTAAAGCGDDVVVRDDDGRPTVVVTTSILGDVVTELVAGQAEVVTVMPAGADPHDFQASARQVNELRQADALIVNGDGLEEGLLDVVAAAEEDGVPTLEASALVDGLDRELHGEEDGHDEDSGDDEHDDEEGDGHDHAGDDAHFFTDPVRMATAAEGIVDFLATNLAGVDAEALADSGEAYVSELRRLDAEVEELLGAVPEERRVLVTDHDVFGHFAERYGFEVAGTIVPGGSTTDAATAADLARSVELVESREVPAIFTSESMAGDLVRTVAEEAGVEVVELFAESLGSPGSGAGTYVAMVRTNAERVADALA